MVYTQILNLKIQLLLLFSFFPRARSKKWHHTDLLRTQLKTNMWKILAGLHSLEGRAATAQVTRWPACRSAHAARSAQKLAESSGRCRAQGEGEPVRAEKASSVDLPAFGTEAKKPNTTMTFGLTAAGDRDQGGVSEYILLHSFCFGKVNVLRIKNEINHKNWKPN